MKADKRISLSDSDSGSLPGMLMLLSLRSPTLKENSRLGLNTTWVKILFGSIYSQEEQTGLYVRVCDPVFIESKTGLAFFPENQSSAEKMLLSLTLEHLTSHYL